MNYQEAVSFLFKALPMYQRVGKVAYKKDLTNTLKLCGLLDDPQNKFKSVHIAGTNGKGSSAHMIAAILQCAGYKVGLYTSPHLRSFTERIKISGVEIPECVVSEFVTQYKGYIEAIQPSFFEITVVMAFDYFAREEVDIAIIETGLGGRLDSTNVITPLVSLITNIGYDHQDMLGDSLEKIAAEKAGIIKKGVPVVIGEYQQEIANTFHDIAIERNAKIINARDFYQIISKELKLDVLKESDVYVSDITPQLKGKYQLRNIPGVLAVIDELNKIDFSVNTENIKSGIQNTVDLTGLKGRWQQIGISPLVICDTAHNHAGIQLALEQIGTISYDKLFFVWGMVNDKVIDSILAELPKNAYYFFTQANVPRALDASNLHEEAKALGLTGEVVPDVNEAFKKAKNRAGENDFIYIGGSTFVVAEIEEL